MRWLKSYKEIYEENEAGLLFAFEVFTNEKQFVDWINNELGPDANKYFEDNFEIITILQSMRINPDFRGKGYGKQLIEQFLNKIKTPILLVADIYEEQNKGFDLVRFYEKYGFEKIDDANSGVLMIRS